MDRNEREYTRENNRWTRTGVGDISGTLTTYLRRKAKERDMVFEVTAEELWNLYLTQNKQCAISGIPLHISTTIDSNHNINRSNMTASLDRIDNKVGYILSNVQWVHKTVNAMRRQYSVKEYIDWCTLVANNNKIDDNNSL